MGGGWGFCFEAFEGGFDGGDGELVGFGVGGGGDSAVGDEGLDGGDVIEAGDEDLTGFAGGLDGGGGTEGHGVAGAEDGFQVGVLADEGLGEGVGLFEVIVGGFDGDDLELGLSEGGFETGAALLAGEVGGRAVDDGDGVARLAFFGEGETDLMGCGLVVRADEGGWHVGGGEGGVDGEDADALGGGAFEGGDEGAWVGGGDDEGLDAGGGELVNVMNLGGEVGGVVDALDGEGVVGGMRGLVGDGVLDEGGGGFGGEGFEDEGDLRRRAGFLR